MTAAEKPNPPAQAARDRSRRVLVWWAVGLGLLAVLALGCWLVAVPALQVRRAAGGLQGLQGLEYGYFPGPAQAGAAIEGLGGPEMAARKIGLYLRLPASLTGGISDRVNSAALLGYCGKPGLREIRALLGRRGDAQRGVGWWGLYAFTLADHHGQLPSGDLKVNLQHALETGDPETRRLISEMIEITEREEKQKGIGPVYPE